MPKVLHMTWASGIALLKMALGNNIIGVPVMERCTEILKNS